MTISLQGYLFETNVKLLPSAMVRCRCCNALITVSGHEEIDAEEGVIAPDFEDSLECGMAYDGWERGNCPCCVNSYPNLAKHDAEEDEQ